MEYSKRVSNGISPIVSLDITEDEAKILTINIRRIMGEFNPFKLATLLKNLDETIGDSITLYLDISKRERELLYQLTSPEKFGDVKILETNKIDQGQLLLFLTPEDRVIFDKAVELAEGTSRSKKVVFICSEFIKSKDVKVE